MRKVNKEDLYGFWKAIDEENENEIHLLIRDNGNARFSESKNDHYLYAGKFEIVGEGENQLIKIAAEKEIELKFKHLWVHKNLISFEINELVLDFRRGPMIWAAANSK